MSAVQVVSLALKLYWTWVLDPSGVVLEEPEEGFVNLEARHDGSVGADFLHDAIRSQKVVAGPGGAHRVCTHGNLQRFLIGICRACRGLGGTAQVGCIVRCGCHHSSRRSSTARLRGLTGLGLWSTGADDVSAVGLVVGLTACVCNTLDAPPVYHAEGVSSVAGEGPVRTCLVRDVWAGKGGLGREILERGSVGSAVSRLCSGSSRVCIAGPALSLVQYWSAIRAIALILAPVLAWRGSIRGRWCTRIARTRSGSATCAPIALRNGQSSKWNSSQRDGIIDGLVGTWDRQSEILWGTIDSQRKQVSELLWDFWSSEDDVGAIRWKVVADHCGAHTWKKDTK